MNEIILCIKIPLKKIPRFSPQQCLFINFHHFYKGNMKQWDISMYFFTSMETEAHPTF